MQGRILTVAESDSCGGAGIQADIKTILAMGGYASSAITALTVQNSKGIFGFEAVSPEFVARQMRIVLDDIGTDVIKVGVLQNTAMIDAVGDVLDDMLSREYKVVIDPSMVDRAGKQLLDMEAIAALKRRLLVRATVLVPNRQEAELLTGMEIKDLKDMRHATDMMRSLGADAVVLKGGQITDDVVVDLVATDAGETILESPVQDTPHTLGAGSTFSSGIATALAQGMDIVPAVERALAFLNKSIETAPGFGEGTGPLNHGHAIEVKMLRAA